MGVRLYPFGVVHETGEYDDAQHEEEHEQRQLLGRSPERLYEDLQPGGVSSQLEKPHDPDDGEELQDVGVLQMGRELLENQVDVEAQRGYVVYDVHRGFDELALVRGRYEPDEDLEGEPCVTYTFNVEECHVGVCLGLV